MLPQAFYKDFNQLKQHRTVHAGHPGSELQFPESSALCTSQRGMLRSKMADTERALRSKA